MSAPYWPTKLRSDHRPDRTGKIRLQFALFTGNVGVFMFSDLVKRLFTAFAFMALAGILAFGGAIRYLCYCAGTPVLTKHEHCHGEHGEHGPIDHAAPGHRHDEHHDHDGDPRQEDHDDHRHELVKSSIELRLPEGVTAPELKLIPLLWTALGERDTAWNPASVSERPIPEIAEDPPPLTHQVVRAVVRLI